MNRISRLGQRIGQLSKQGLGVVLGDFSWRPPVWCRRVGGSLSASPRWWLGLGAAMLVVMGVGLGIYGWMRQQPKEGFVEVTIKAPAVSPIVEGKIVPQPLIVNFSQSTALISEVGKKVVRGVELSPSLPGTWMWNNDQQLVFSPAQDWPAGTRYTVQLQKGLFPGHVKLTTYRPTFDTEPFGVKFSSLEFYVNPKDPRTKEVTGTLTFTHPVDETAVQAQLAVSWQGHEDLFQYPDKKATPFTVTMGEANRVAYIRSLPVTLPEEETFLTFTLNKGLKTKDGSGVSKEKLTEEVRIPNLASFLRFNNIFTSTAERPDGDPEQVLVVESTVGVKTEELKKRLHVYLLPKDKPAQGREKAVADFEWSSVWEMDNAWLTSAQELKVSLNPTELEYATVHSIKFSAPAERYLCVKIDGGMGALGGFMMPKAYTTVTKVVPYPKALHLMHDGAILALSGERRLSVLSRGLKQIEYRIGRVDSKEVNNLVSQSSGNFQSPVFQSYHFGEDNICDVITRKVSVTTPAGKTNYGTLDFSEYLTDRKTGDRRGLFIVRVAEMDPTRDEANADRDPDPDNNRWSDHDNEENLLFDRRLILVTDLGIIAKQNADSSQEVFVQSIKTGRPVGDATVEVLGKNGRPVATGSTDSSGHVALPVLKDFKREKEPVAIVVRRGDDFSFMPYGRADRRLNYSRYDISGLEPESPSMLDAFVFSDRGIYRPGDTIHLGVALKQMDWKGNITGLPVELVVNDPRGHSWTAERVKVPAGGFFDWSFTPAEAAPTGEYTLGVHLVKDGERGDLLGSTTVRVEEFLPDRLKIKAALSSESADGWVRPEELKVNVELQNLYGTAAAGNRVTGKMSLTPAALAFPRYADFTFFDPLLKETVRREAHEEELMEATTDDSGKAALELNLARFDQSAYRLVYLARGYEKESGRSVAVGREALVSARPWLMGVKADGDLNYISRQGKRVVSLLAVDPQLNPFAAGDLKLVISEQYYLSVLTKKPNGNFAYQSVLKEREVKNETLHFDAREMNWTVPTVEPGDFVARLYDSANLCVAVVRYTVVGVGNLTRQLERNAELKAKIAKSEYAPGETISISLTAPYMGSGLITIERDRVVAHEWFTARSLSSEQKITLPKDFEGNGYINVAFVRALDSKEIFMSPLSYAVIPFRVSRDKRTVKIELNAPEKVTPGEVVKIGYKSNRPAKVVVYGVDEGILQVAGYALPHPLDHFFQKRALQVTTDQIMDMILPEYSISREMAAAGGDGREDLLAANLNPFKRKGEAPVVFWSGVVDCSEKNREISYRVPDYFNGTLRVMAIAVSDEAAGAAQRKVTARGPFVIQPNVPTFAAPGDTFAVGVTIANNVVGSGAKAEVSVDVDGSEGVEIVQRPTSPVVIPEGRDAVISVQCRAKDLLGDAALRFVVRQGAVSTRYETHLSVRPAVAYHTEIKSGVMTKKSETITLSDAVYPQYFKGQANASILPLGLSRGLQLYLDDYPHLCSEQITSRAFPLVMMAGENEFGVPKIRAAEVMKEVTAVLRSRQNDQGGIGLWKAVETEPFDFVTPYVMQFLTEAKDREFEVMPDLMENGLEFLKETAKASPKSLVQARNQALAIYLLTRNGVVATNYLDRLRDFLEQKYPAIWKNDLAGVYCAGAYAQLRNQREADRLIGEFKMEQKPKLDYCDFYSDLGRDAQYLYILSRHFPNRLKTLTPENLQGIIQPILEDRFNTHGAAYAIVGLQAYAEAASAGAETRVTLSATSDGNDFQSLPTVGTLAPLASLQPTATALRVERDGGSNTPIFYQVSRSGFERQVPDKAIVQGIEVQREYRNLSGHLADRAALGEELEVHVMLRAIDRSFVDNIAIVDLLPGGFEVVIDSVRMEAAGVTRDGSRNAMETIPAASVDAREDRVVIYGSAIRSMREFVYRIKAVNCGQFTVPPIQAESMYNRQIQSRTTAGRIQVGELK